MLRYLRNREEDPTRRRMPKRPRMSEILLDGEDETENVVSSENKPDEHSNAKKSVPPQVIPHVQTPLAALATLPPSSLKFTHASTLNPYPENPVEWKMLFLKKKSRVQEILAVGESLLITLQHSGICCVFKREDTKRKLFVQHGYLNHKPEEIVRSLFFNRAARAVVIVSVYPAEKKAVLRCRSISVADLEQGHFDRAVPILAQEVLGFPGWIELCEVNSRILTYSAETSTYKVWDLENDYAFLYEIIPARGEKLVDVKASPGFLLLIYEPTTIPGENRKIQRISLVDIQDGRELYMIHHPLTTRVELVEQFCDSILIKEQDQDLVMHNIRKNPVTAAGKFAPVYGKVNMSPAKLNAFTFLHNSRVFLTFQSGGRVSSYDSHGQEIVVIHEDDPSTRREDQSTIVLVARDQDTLLCVRSAVDHRTGARSAVEFRHVLTGKLLARVPLELSVSDVTSVCYDEERATLFVGTRDGYIHVWN